jgi:TatA/E family protein of Tat protein translocase
MGPIGVQEMIVIFIVALVVFGPKKLPELGKTVGKALTEFRRARDELKYTFDREMQAIERETATVKQDIQKHVDEINTSTGDLPHDHYHDSGYGNDAYYDNYDSYSYHSESTGTETASSETTADTVGASATQGADNSISATDVATALPSPAGPEGTIPVGSADAAKPDGEPRPRTPRGPAVVA